MTRLVLPDSSRPIRFDSSDVDRAVVEALNASGLNKRPGAIGALVEKRIEAYLTELALLRVAAMAHSTRKWFRSVTPEFYLDAQAYEIRIAKHVRDFATIELAIVKAGTGSDASSRRAPVKLALDGHGHYSTATLYVDDELRGIEELVAADIQATFTAGYRWLEARAMGRLAPAMPDLANELYEELRTVLDRDLADRVGLYGLCKQDAFYLLDPRVVLKAFARSPEQRVSVALSPIECTRLLVTQLLDPMETMSRISLAEGRHRLLELEKSLYAQTKLNLAERDFYNTNYLMHYPLVRDGKLQLTAAYPAHMNEYISPVLDRIADRSADIALRHAKSALKRVYRQGREQYVPHQAEDFVTLAGIFAGAAAGTFSKM